MMLVRELILLDLAGIDIQRIRLAIDEHGRAFKKSTTSADA